MNLKELFKRFFAIPPEKPAPPPAAPKQKTDRKDSPSRAVVKKQKTTRKDSPSRAVVKKQKTTRKDSPSRAVVKKKPEKEQPVSRPKIAKKIRRVNVIIGLDFGTAFTKVVIDGAGQKYGVPLNESAQGTDKYLLPTVIYENTNGGLSLTRPKNFRRLHSDLKMQILDNNLDDAGRKQIVSYLAMVLQKSRNWLTSEKRAVFGDARFDWIVNIGLPTENHDDAELSKTYEELVRDAWRESVGPPSEKPEAVKSNDTERELPSGRIRPFPEFAAQIHYYISSPKRRLGLHVLVDVGAGTTDSTVFIVHRDDDEDKLPYLTESVKPLGTARLANHRCDKLGKPNGWKPPPGDSFPALAEFAERLGVTEQDVEAVDDEFKSNIQRQINGILKDAYDKLPGQLDWEKEVRMMLCGGGARVKFYEKFYYRDNLKILEFTKYGCCLRKFPPPAFEKLDAPGLQDEDHDRLSVAYGLSFADLGHTSRLSPLESRTEDTGRKVCPACNGTGIGHPYCPKCDGNGLL